MKYYLYALRHQYTAYGRTFDSNNNVYTEENLKNIIKYSSSNEEYSKQTFTVTKYEINDMTGFIVNQRSLFGMNSLIIAEVLNDGKVLAVCPASGNEQILNLVENIKDENIDECRLNTWIYNPTILMECGAKPISVDEYDENGEKIPSLQEKIKFASDKVGEMTRQWFMTLKEEVK